MALDPTVFKKIIPSRYISFTIPNPLLDLHYFNASQLRIAVLDSPIPSKLPQIAAMLVPINRESDWYFSTEQGHRQLLVNFPQLSRLVLIGNSPNSMNPISYNWVNRVMDSSVVEDKLMPLLIELMPIEAFRRTGGGGLGEIPFLRYEDEVVRSVVLDICVGDFVGEMLIENVEMELEDSGGREYRRRLRFKRMPNLVQTQIKIQPKKVDFVNMEEVEFEIVDDGVLVHPYLTPMVAGLSVIESFLNAKIASGINPKALCLGVGGGALLGFLRSQLGFQVLGIEVDDVVLQVARRFFGLKDSNSMHLCVGDALEMIGKFATQVDSDGFRGYLLENGERFDDFDGKFDVIMADLDSSDAYVGMSAPPLAFVQKSALLATRTLLNKDGVVIINVIPSDQSSYKLVIAEIQEVFAELYEIDVGNGDNFVLIASASEIRHGSSGHQSKFLQKLKQVSGSYVDSIRII
ncbi:eEF1A lysine and N-terminal methyltransferase [Capsicum chacoense]